MRNIREIDFSPEWEFRTSRSGGKGGQNVNKVETKVELLWNVSASNLATEEEKQKITERLAKKINDEGILQITSSADRSQLQNKENTTAKFYDLLENALKERKKRKATKPHKGAVEKRIKEKKMQSEKKSMRKFDM